MDKATSERPSNDKIVRQFPGNRCEQNLTCETYFVRLRKWRQEFGGIVYLARMKIRKLKTYSRNLKIKGHRHIGKFNLSFTFRAPSRVKFSIAHKMSAPLHLTLLPEPPAALSVHMHFSTNLKIHFPENCVQGTRDCHRTAVAHIYLIDPQTALTSNALRGTLTSTFCNESPYDVESTWTASFKGLHIDTAGQYRIRIILGFATQNGVVVKQIQDFGDIHILAGEEGS